MRKQSLERDPSFTAFFFHGLTDPSIPSGDGYRASHLLQICVSVFLPPGISSAVIDIRGERGDVK